MPALAVRPVASMAKPQVAKPAKVQKVRQEAPASAICRETCGMDLDSVPWLLSWRIALQQCCDNHGNESRVLEQLGSVSLGDTGSAAVRARSSRSLQAHRPPKAGGVLAGF